MNEICCFCKKPIKGYGNNLWPANKDPHARCCDTCNLTIVIPTRMIDRPTEE